MSNWTVQINNCAYIANAVYNKPHQKTFQWKMIPSLQEGNPRNKFSSRDGFYGAAYEFDNEVIIAIRGTSDFKDAWHDSYMAPYIPKDRAYGAMRKLVAEYCTANPNPHDLFKTDKNFEDLIAKQVAEMFEGLKAGGIAKNKVPPEQIKPALLLTRRVVNYCIANNKKILCFVGHSLGGAMAQYLSEQTGENTMYKRKIGAVAFNSPYMGSMEGMKPGKGGGILYVNAKLDPLSFLTREVGNVSHAFTKTSPNEYKLAYASSVEPYPGSLDYPKFSGWLLKCMGYYHGMDNLIELLVSRRVGQLNVKNFLFNT